MKTSKLHDVIAYFCVNYPYSNELSKARTTKLVYLADWRMALLHKRQITSINWIFNHYGPYVDDVVDEVRRSSDLELEHGSNAFGSPAGWIRAVDDDIVTWPSLTEDEIAVLDDIIEVTKPMNFSRFLSFVYETYPVVKSKRYDYLNLVALAEKRRAEDRKG